MPLNNMIELTQAKSFIRAYKKFVKKNPQRAKDLLEALQRFRTDIHHPSLNTEKLRHSDIWSIRIDIKNRIYFMWVDHETTLLIDIGPHDKNRKY